MKTLQIALIATTLVAGIGLGFGVARWKAPSAPAPVAKPASAPSAAAAAASAERRVLYWYDPMEPAQKFDMPGKSPFMDMQLVPRYDDDDAATATAAASAPALSLSTAAQQALGLRLARAEQRNLAASVDANGNVQLNDRDVALVQARAAGFVERIYARAPGDVIRAGAPLVDLLMPDWRAAQLEYLAVKATGDAALAQAARQRLLLLGMAAALVERVDRGGAPLPTQTIAAPIGGVITELAVRSGMSVAAGALLARINGLDTVWLEAAVPEGLAAAVQPGQAVQLRFAAWPGEVTPGRVAAILPESNRDSHTLRLRIELPNRQHRLQAGMFAQVTLQGAPRSALVVPAEAVIRTGRRAIVYVADAPGRFRPAEVELGAPFDDAIEIRAGLVAGQQVVASGQFLLDSEAGMQGVLARAPELAASAALATSGAGASR